MWHSWHSQGIVGSDNKAVYSFEQIPGQNYTVVSIENITSEEFNRLSSLLNSEKTVSASVKELQIAKEIALKELSEICNATIVAGFSIKLLDGNTYNFRLTTEDQLNLLSLENQLNAGEKIFIYNATGLPCKVFTRDDISKIIKAYRKHMLYHTTYFNAAKQYINSLIDIDKVKAFYYGADVLGIIENPTLCQILSDGGVHR